MKPQSRLFLFLLGALAVPALRAQTTVELNVERSETYVKEPLIVEIVIRNFRKCELPDFPKIPDCAVNTDNNPLQSGLSIEFNGQKISRAYRFQLTPRKVGELVIPPIPVKVDGKTFETESVKIKVKPSNADELAFAEITADAPRLYVGQRVRLMLRIFVKPAKFGAKKIDSNTMLQQFEGGALGPFPQRVRQDEERRQTASGATETYYVYETATDYTLTRPGPLTFDNVAIGINYPTRTGQDIFNRPVISSWRTLRIEPTIKTPDVLPLPTEGRPANFTGAVGRFAMFASAEPTAVRVGDPIKLKIEISGTGDLDMLPPPLLAADPQLTRMFRVSIETPVGETSLGRRRFTQIVRALRPDVTAIPPLEYAYFDPQDGQYQIARSKAISLTVTAVEKLEAADLTSIAPAQTAAPPTGPEPLDGLRGNETRENALLAGVRPVQLWQVAAITFTPPAVFALAWGYMTYSAARAGNTTGRRRQAALANARRRIETALRALNTNEKNPGATDWFAAGSATSVETTATAPKTPAHATSTKAAPAATLPREVSAALAGYLADRLNEPPARFAGQAALEFLRARGVSAETLGRWTDVIERCEQAAFGGFPDGDAAALVRQAGECLERLERERI